MLHKSTEANQLTCILKWNDEEQTDFSNINVRYNPATHTDDKGKMRVSCHGTAKDANVHHHLAITHITKLSQSSRTVALSFKRNVDATDALSGKFLKLHGECVANSDEYYVVSIDFAED